MTPTLLYFHDPMCSWCWGYRPTWQKLKQALAGRVVIRSVVGGLAPDSDEPMPVELQQAIAGYWRRIEVELGARFNHDFWTQCEPRRSTYPACRAVIAARAQDREAEMIEAIQRAYYLNARNPSDVSTLVEIANEAGLDAERFSSDIASIETERTLQQEVAFARQAPIRGFPSLVLERDGRLMALPLDYLNHETTLAAMAPYLPESDSSSV